MSARRFSPNRMGGEINRIVNSTPYYLGSIFHNKQPCLICCSAKFLKFPLFFEYS
jgi:hypothetical protein